MEYTNTTLISQFLQRDLTDNEKGYLKLVIPAIRIWVDKRLSTTFVKKTVPETRYYDGGKASLDIDACTDITSVGSLNDDGSSSYSYTVGTEYIAEPQNQNVKREIRRRLGNFPSGIKRIAITALFTEYDDGVPADIQIMATRLATGVMNTGKNIADGGAIQSESLEGHSVTYSNNVNIEGIATSDPTVMAILKQRDELLIDDYDTPRKPGYDEDAFYL